jgi:predicted DNA-binding antitoxin AbrB/MazE fold protein
MEETTMTINAVFKDGVFHPREAVDLPDNCEVQITNIEVISHPSSSTDFPLLRLAKALEKFPPDPERPTDLSYQHDHYLYGTPKRP